LWARKRRIVMAQNSTWGVADGSAEAEGSVVQKDLVKVEGLWKLSGQNQSLATDPDGASITKQEALENHRTVIALNDVSFSVDRAETFVVMGLSGSGKSTLVHCRNTGTPGTTVPLDGGMVTAKGAPNDAPFALQSETR
jgi:ABC-type multidrug transport system ATPase subunit